MTALVAAAVLGSTLPASPDLDDVEKGKAFARRVSRTDLQRVFGIEPSSGKQKTIHQLIEPFQVSIGRWSTGFEKITVEYGIELTPQLIGQWLGFLAERELWAPNELETRWESLRDKMGGRRYFIVVLSAFPRKATLGFGDQVAQSDLETKQVIFTLESSMGRTEPSGFLVHGRRASTLKEIGEIPWWTLTPFEEELTSVFEGQYKAPVIQRGDYHRVWWMIWSDTDLGQGPVTLKIASQRKVREATFEASSDTGS